MHTTLINHAYESTAYVRAISRRSMSRTACVATFFVHMDMAKYPIELA
jgi:hypothetical protein